MAGSQAVSRHLVFVLEDGTIVIQRGANLVEGLETHEHRAFDSYDHHHDITDSELRDLQHKNLIYSFDDVTVWLPIGENVKLDLGKARYYFLDTRLSAPYQRFVQSVLESANLEHQYRASAFSSKVVIVNTDGEPFSSLNDAEAAFTLVRQALGEQIPTLCINHMTIDIGADDTSPRHPRSAKRDLVSTMTMPTLQNAEVLLIEDNPEHIKILEKALENLDLAIRVATTGEAAWEIILDEEPDLVILDLTLPDIHGYQVIARIKKDPMTAETPIIALSGTSSESDMVFALYVAKVDEYLVKPIEPRIIRQRVLNLLARAM